MALCNSSIAFATAQDNRVINDSFELKQSRYNIKVCVSKIEKLANPFCHYRFVMSFRMIQLVFVEAPNICSSPVSLQFFSKRYVISLECLEDVEPTSYC